MFRKRSSARVMIFTLDDSRFLTRSPFCLWIVFCTWNFKLRIFDLAYRLLSILSCCWKLWCVRCLYDVCITCVWCLYGVCLGCNQGHQYCRCTPELREELPTSGDWRPTAGWPPFLCKYHGSIKCHVCVCFSLSLCKKKNTRCKCL